MREALDPKSTSPRLDWLNAAANVADINHRLPLCGQSKCSIDTIATNLLPLLGAAFLRMGQKRCSFFVEKRLKEIIAGV